MDEKTQEYIRKFFEDVMVDGISRELEFQQEPDGFDITDMTVKLITSGYPKKTVYLGFPKGWRPPEKGD